MTYQEFNPLEWLTKFHQAVEQNQGISELRALIYKQTIDYVLNRSFQNSKIRSLDFPLIQPENSYFFEKPTPLINQASDFSTFFEVVNQDCLEVAEMFNQNGNSVCVLNMANRQKPGGGVIRGAGAQEENLFRRSNLFQSLYQFVDFGELFQVPRNLHYSYPLNRESGGIFSQNITVFRSSEKTGYSFLEKPFQISIVTVPAINSPDLELINGKWFIKKELIEPTKEKIRTILRISASFQEDNLVLGAFGCGAFKNPPQHVATLFKEVFQEVEFRNRFRKVVFAIFEDHNSRKAHNPEGNLLPFQEVFGTINGRID